MLLSVAVWSGSCGSSPMSPAPVGPVSPPVTATNAPPVIESIVASAPRAEVDTDVTGTPTPADYAIRLTVTESYGAGGAQQNLVNGTGPSVRLHDSPKELESLSMTFLGDFANSSVSPSTCVRDFSDGCRGKAEEKSDIESNREHFVITNSSLRLRVSPSGMSGDTSVACSFTSRIIKCEPGDKSCSVGSVGTVAGDCALTAVYEQQRWWLCTSSFLNGRQIPLAFRSFFSSKPN